MGGAGSSLCHTTSTPKHIKKIAKEYIQEKTTPVSVRGNFAYPFQSKDYFYKIMINPKIYLKN